MMRCTYIYADFMFPYPVIMFMI